MTYTPPPDSSSPAPSTAAPRRPRSRRRWLGFGFVGLGALSAALAVSYLLYAQVARERLGGLEATVPEKVQRDWVNPPAPTRAPVGTPASGQAVPSGPSVGASPTPFGTTEGTTVAVASSAFHAVDSLYPASATNPKYWDTPLWAGSGPYGGPGLPEGFDYVSSYDAGRPVGTMEDARRIVIPAIGVDSEVSELAIVDLGDSRAYETPAHVVGHIPGTANPGENGNGWYFGHLESPFLGEGNVFYRLPEIAQLLKEDPVDVIVEGKAGAYLYRVIATKVVHQDAVSLFEAPVGTVTLVACVPSRVYDHRLLVTAQLIAEKTSEPGI